MHHPGHDPSVSAQPIDRRIARQAARWFVRLQGNASPRDREACDHWRASHADHERAWQLAAGFHARFDAIPADIGMPALGRPASLDRRHTLKLLTSLIIAAPLGTLAYQALPWREWSADQRTVAGERRECVLPDGTRVMLNTASAMDIRFDGQQRLLRLYAGEILVSTAADPLNRPLVVETAEGRLRPVGTRFDVRQLDGKTRIAVLEGAVQVYPAHAKDFLRLEAGQQTEFSRALIAPVATLQRSSSDWTQGVLRAEKMRLADFALELGRYRPGLLRCDPAVADWQISGTFQLHDTDLALAALARTLPVDIRTRSRYWVTIAARES